MIQTVDCFVSDEANLFIHFYLLKLLSCAGTLTKFDVRTRLATLVCVQDQKADFEEEAVSGGVQTAHLVEAIVAHHQRDEPYSFA